ncbi:hypothetical protein DB35_25105 [Streptomyces abyssalis]|uniref:DUF6545 domain-containing protein n=1 Tax=Streptomyces abyssalis TaxID=933944 RepID=A0A1E7JN83_9ACTN|nr:MAB_1171c family putative transporter [Streptomyces abyssalis]OEU86877.1 hypothetical protein DB35_25105 [Streptomyces abyssalis]OEU89739.1 hypothetical protein AN215_08460 [Streptomyces abyssalis]
MQQLLHPICLTLAVTGLLLLLWPPRRLVRDRALAALAGVYGFSALSFLVSLEPVWRALDEATGRPSTGILAAFGSVVALLALQPVVLAHWALPQERARRRTRLCLALGAVVIAALAVIFFQLTPTGRSTPQGFTVNYVHTGAYQAYLTLYIVAYTVGETVLAVGCWRAARRTDEIWIARGLRIVGVGAVVTFGYSAVRLAYVVAVLSGLPQPSPAAEEFAWLCADGGTTLSLVGFFVPTLALHAVPHVRAWLRAQRDYRRLAPLWEAVHEAVPTIALNSTRTVRGSRMRVRAITWHLYRRAVEIRDGQWALQPFLEAAVKDASERHRRDAGLTGADLVSAVTADQIRAALTASAREETAQNPVEYADAHTREEVRTPDDDVRALLRMATHFETAPARGENAPSWT